MPPGDFCPTSVGIRRNSDGMHNQDLHNYEVLEYILICKKDPTQVIDSLALGLDGHLIYCSGCFPVIQKGV